MAGWQQSGRFFEKKLRKKLLLTLHRGVAPAGSNNRGFLGKFFMPARP
jgi:hypothetical protein